MKTENDTTRIVELFDVVRAQTPQKMDETKRLVETLCDLHFNTFVYYHSGIKVPVFDLIELIRAPRSARLAIQTVVLEMLVAQNEPDNKTLTCEEIEREVRERWPDHEKALAELGHYEQQRYTDAIPQARKFFDADFPLNSDPKSVFVLLTSREHAAWTVPPAPAECVGGCANAAT